jgi:hypothetical protein
MFGWKGKLSEAQTAEIAATKQVIYDGFKAAIDSGVPKEKAGILVDEKIARKEAVAEVARRYRGFVDLFEKASAKR